MSPQILLVLFICGTYGHVRRKVTSHLTHDIERSTQHVNPFFEHTNSSQACFEDAICVIPVMCPDHVRDEDKITCVTKNGREGFCCHNQTLPANPNERRRHRFVKVDPLTLGIITRHSRVEMADLQEREMKLLHSGRATTVPYGTASYGHYRNSRIYNMDDLADVLNVANRALEIAIATKAFKERQGLSNYQLEQGMIQQDLRPTPLGAACSPPPRCTSFSNRYQRLDGTCNNVRNTHWGSALTSYARLLPPSYSDGIWAPRLSEKHGQPLVSPRLISSKIIEDFDKPHPDYTLMLMQFGQFLAHEITQSIDTSYANGSSISCCSEDGTEEFPIDFRHLACMPISIPTNDEFFSLFNQTCMNFVRSVLATNQHCTLGYAQQMNKVTHFIDGSSIYGTNYDRLKDLRTFVGGRMLTFTDFGRDLLPLSKDPEACLTMEAGSACFTSGDTRTNQMISLVVLHLIFLREHNRIAGELQQLNPHWVDEQLFLETRRIVIAEMQVITYKEFLPAVLGDAAMEEFGLRLETDDRYSFAYDAFVEPTVLNEFATAAFRFGHSVVASMIKLYNSNQVEEMISISEVMFQPSRLRKRQVLDEILSALTTEPIQEVDNSLTDSLTKYLFRAGNPFGVDLAAFNIQRGRDHGLRPYNDYRELIGLPKIRHFEEFGEEMGKKLSSVYESVDDIDIWIGGLLEPKAPGSILSLTFRDIVAVQFMRLKMGDKFFFEHEPNVNPGHFTPDQLRELRKASMSRLVCDNSDGILLKKQGLNAFKMASETNEFRDCSSMDIPRINLIYWRENV